MNEAAASISDVPSRVMAINRRKLNIEQMRQIATVRGGICVSNEYINSGTRLLWQCANKHKWYASPDSVKRGAWCSVCARLARRNTLDEMHQIAGELGGYCLSECYTNRSTHLLWKCALGHQWDATPAAIKHGSWCPECTAENRKILTLGEMQRIANERSGRCLSRIYTDASTVLEWQCQKKHRWHATPGSVKAGSWCRICAVDCTRMTLTEMQALAESHGGQCLSERYVNGTTPMRWRCAQGHTWEASGTAVKSGTWCRACYFDSKRNSLEQMKAMANSKGGKCLSLIYRDSRTQLMWECSAGHTWLAVPDAIKRGWCPACSFDRKRLGIAKMQELAAKHGGRCLSERYVNCLTRLTWQCIKGHRWDSRPNNITRGRWCPECRQIEITKQRVIDKTRKKFNASGPILI